MLFKQRVAIGVICCYGKLMVAMGGLLIAMGSQCLLWKWMVDIKSQWLIQSHCLLWRVGGYNGSQMLLWIANCCYGMSLVATESHWLLKKYDCYGKSMFAMCVASCCMRSLVAMEVYRWN
jgi:hypothetical protein